MMKHFVYILECKDGSLYTGWTTDIIKRFRAHQSGRGARYTKTHYPMRIVHLEIFDDKSEAMKREYEIKHFTREKKKQLIEGGLKKKDSEAIIKTGGITP